MLVTITTLIYCLYHYIFLKATDQRQVFGVCWAFITRMTFKNHLTILKKSIKYSLKNTLLTAAAKHLTATLIRPLYIWRRNEYTQPQTVLIIMEWWVLCLAFKLSLTRQSLKLQDIVRHQVDMFKYIKGTLSIPLLSLTISMECIVITLESNLRSHQLGLN